MKRGQLHTGILVLGIVSVVTLFGLVFMLKFSSISAYGIGTLYGKAPGIAEVTKMPPNYPGGPDIQMPAGPQETRGSRTPIAILFKGEYRNILEMSECFNELAFKLKTSLNCYAVPTYGVAQEVTGFFSPTGSASEFKLGGDVYCYENTPYDREQLMEKIYELGKEDGWSMGEMNGEDVLLCQKGKKFLYPQG